MPWMTGHFGMFWWGLLWWILILGGVYLVIRFLSADRTRTTETPLEILKKRYARGEITTEEFQRMKDELLKR